VIAIVLAGGGPDAVSAMKRGAVNKAFVPVGDVPMVTRTIAALRGATSVTRIIVVAPTATFTSDALQGADECRPSGARMIESLAAGLVGMPPDDPVLIAASDLPLLTPAAVDEFAAEAVRRDLDIAYAIVRSTVHHAQFPRVRHTWATMFEGRYCGGGVFAIKPRMLDALRTVLDELGAARKSPLRLASIFGWDIVPRFAMGALKISAAEERASTILRARVGAICSSHADIAVNVDTPSDLSIANALHAAR
jgi:GTP:adenosylcobinamide-phosphate guanylyltransferase